MSDTVSLPPFVREAIEGESGDADPSEAGGVSASFGPDLERSLLSLEDKLYEQAAPDAAGLEPAEAELAHALRRLELSVGELPHRYAPFFSNLAQLFDWPEETVISELTRLREPRVWRFAGLPGIAKVVAQAGPALQSAETLFVRFNPGVQFPRHRHTGIERVLVLEGSYEDDAGVVHRPGELREWAVGTEHAFKVHTGAPCIFASVVYGRRFDAWPLRALASLLEPRSRPR